MLEILQSFFSIPLSDLRGCDDLCVWPGERLGGFAKFVGQATTFVAELWGVYEGLSLARAIRFMEEELQVDSEVVVQSLEGDSIGSVHGTRLV